MSGYNGPHVAAELVTFEKPVGKIVGFVVTCRCGWRSQMTTSWSKSLDSHFYRLMRSGEDGA